MTTTTPPPTDTRTVTWDSLVREIGLSLATVLVEEKGETGQAFYRIVVRRAAGDVWEARKAYHHRDRVAVRWSPEEVAAIERAERSQEDRATRLRAELEGGRIDAGSSDTTFLTLAIEVAQGQARILDCSQDSTGRIIRMVVRRAGGSVWEAVRPGSGEQPAAAVRWTEWEVDNLPGQDPRRAAHNLRLGALMAAALNRARRAPLAEAPL